MSDGVVESVTNLFIQWREGAAVIILCCRTFARGSVHVRDPVIRAMARKVAVRDCLDLRAIPISFDFLRGAGCT